MWDLAQWQESCVWTLEILIWMSFFQARSSQENPYSWEDVLIRDMKEQSFHPVWETFWLPHLCAEATYLFSYPGWTSFCCLWKNSLPLAQSPSPLPWRLWFFLSHPTTIPSEHCYPEGGSAPNPSGCLFCLLLTRCSQIWLPAHSFPTLTVKQLPGLGGVLLSQFCPQWPIVVVWSQLMMGVFTPQKSAYTVAFLSGKPVVVSSVYCWLGFWFLQKYEEGLISPRDSLGSCHLRSQEVRLSEDFKLLISYTWQG